MANKVGRYRRTQCRHNTKYPRDALKVIRFHIRALQRREKERKKEEREREGPRRDEREEGNIQSDRREEEEWRRTERT